MVLKIVTTITMTHNILDSLNPYFSDFITFCLEDNLTEVLLDTIWFNLVDIFGFSMDNK